MTIRIGRPAVHTAPRQDPMPKYLKELQGLVYDKNGWPADLSKFPKLTAAKLPPAVKKAGEAWANKEEGNIDDVRRVDVGGRTAYVVGINIPNDGETSWGAFKIYDPHGKPLDVKEPKRIPTHW